MMHTILLDIHGLAFAPNARKSKHAVGEIREGLFFFLIAVNTSLFNRWGKQPRSCRLAAPSGSPVQSDGDGGHPRAGDM